MNNTGLVSVSFRKLNCEQIIAATKKAGLKYIEWGSDVHIPENNIENAKTVAALTEENDLKVSSYGSYYRLGEGQNFMDYINTAKILKAPIIRIWAGVKGSKEVNEDLFEKLVKEAKEISKMAWEHNIKVCFEYHPNTLTDTKESALKLLQAVSEPNCRIYWQPNFKLSHEENINALKTVLDYVEIIHLFFWNENYDKLRLKDGIEIWKDYLKCIKNKDIKYLLEFVQNDDEAILTEEADALNKILN